MRKINLEVYSIYELSESAKKAAYQNWLDSEQYAWGMDNEKVLEAFCEIFPINVYQWEYDENSSYFRFEMECEEEITNLSGHRLAKYIWNNYKDFLYKGKYYNKHTGKSRDSKIQLKSYGVLTGYWIDDEIMQPLYNFLNDPNEVMDFFDLMHECLTNFVGACSLDVADYFSEEHFIDICNENEWEFYESGDRYFD
jgi:hypothetical protein